MLDLNEFPYLYWERTVSGETGSKNLSNIERHNIKILTDAQDRVYDYTSKRNRMGWTFESLMRSVGLAAGVVVGGPLGAATMGSIGGGIGRGIGEHVGNKVYGKTLYELDNVINDYKYRQLSNGYALSKNQGTMSMNDELYKQTLKTQEDLANELGQPMGS